MLPARKNNDKEMPIVAPTFTARPVNFYRVKRVLNYDYSSRKAFVTEKSIKETIRLMYKLWKIQLKSRWKYRKTVKKYLDRGNELMKLDFS